MGGVRETGCSMTEQAGLTDVLHVSGESRGGQKAQPGTTKVGGAGRCLDLGAVPFSPALAVGWALFSLLRLCLEHLAVGGSIPS